MGCHYSGCFCKSGKDGKLIECGSCARERQHEEAKKQKERKRRMDQFIDDLNDPEFCAAIAKRLGIYAGGR